MVTNAEFLEEVNAGLQQDWQIEKYLLDNILDDNHLIFLRENELSIINLLHGGYPSYMEFAVQGWMVSVNNLLGGQLFRW